MSRGEILQCARYTSKEVHTNWLLSFYLPSIWPVVTWRVALTWEPVRPQRGSYTERGARTEGLISDRVVNSHWARKVLMSFLETHGASSLSYSFPMPSGTESFAGVGLVLFWGIGAQVYGGALTWISRKKKSHRVMTGYV